MPIIIEDDPKVEDLGGQGLRVPGPAPSSLLPEADRLFQEARVGLEKDFPGIKFGKRLSEVDAPADFVLGKGATPDFTIGNIDPHPQPEVAAAPVDEPGWGETIARGAKAGIKQFKVMTLGKRLSELEFDPAKANPEEKASLLLAEDAKKFRALPKEEQDRQTNEVLTSVKAAQDEINGLGIQSDSYWKNATFGAANSVAFMAPALATGAIAGTPAVLTSIGTMTYWTSYAQHRANGASPEKARQLAGIDGTVEAVTELLPTGKLLSKTGVFKKAVQEIVYDVPGEVVANYVQTATANLAKLPDDASQDDILASIRASAAEATRDIPQVAGITALAGGAQAGGVRAVQAAAGALAGGSPQAPPSAAPPPAPAATPPPAQPPPGPAPAAPAAGPAAPAGEPKAGDVAMFQPNQTAPGTVVQIHKVTPSGFLVSRMDEDGEPVLDKDGQPQLFVATKEDLHFVGGTPTPSAAGGVTSSPSPSQEGVAPATAAPANPPADTSAEPIRDIAAQVRDMWTASTPRRGVYISPATIQMLQQRGQLQNFLKQGVHETNFDGQGGTLLVKSKKDMEEATAMRDSGMVDMQELIGRLTGAGIAKPKGPAKVVQRRDATGGVVQQTAVVPAAVPAAVAEQAALPGQVEVTSPEAVIAEREQVVEREKLKPGDVIGAAGEAVMFATTQLNTPKEGNLQKTDVRASAQAVGVAAQILRQAANDALARGAPAEVVGPAIRVAASIERIGDKPEKDFVKGRGVSEPKLRAKLAEIQAALATLEPYRNAAKVAAPATGVKGETAKRGKKPQPSQALNKTGDKQAQAALAQPAIAEGVKEDQAKARETILAPVVAAEEAARAEMPPKVREVVEKAEAVFSKEQERRKAAGQSPTGTERRAGRQVLAEHRGYTIEAGPAGTFQARSKENGLGVVGQKSIEDVKARLDEAHAPQVGATGVQVVPPGERVVHRKKKYVPPKKTAEQVAEKVAEDTAPGPTQTIDIIPAAVVDQGEFIQELLGATPQELQQEVALDKSGQLYNALASIIQAMKDRNNWTGWMASITRGGVMPRTHRNQLMQTIRTYASASRQDLPAAREQMLGLLTNIEGKTLPQGAIAAVFDAANVARVYTTMAMELRDAAEGDTDLGDITRATTEQSFDKAQVNPLTGSLGVAKENEIGGTARNRLEIPNAPPRVDNSSLLNRLVDRALGHPFNNFLVALRKSMYGNHFLSVFAERSLKASESGGPLPGLHEFLDGVLSSGSSIGIQHMPYMRILRHIRIAAPNIPIEFFREGQQMLNAAGEPVQGRNPAGRILWEGVMQIPVTIDSKGRPVFDYVDLQTIIHEAAHAAMMYEQQNKTRLNDDITKLRLEIIEKAYAVFGREPVFRALAALEPGLPGGVEAALSSEEVKELSPFVYALVNNLEFTAEVLSSPAFHTFLQTLDQGRAKTWYRQVWSRVVRMMSVALGLKNPADNRLLNDALVLSLRATRAQKGRADRVLRARNKTIEALTTQLSIPLAEATRLVDGLYSHSLPLAKVQEDADKFPGSAEIFNSINARGGVSPLAFHVYTAGPAGIMADLTRAPNTLAPPNAPPRLKNHEQIAALSSPRLADAAAGVRRLLTSRVMDKIRDAGLGFVTTDFLVERGARLFGVVNDITNPLVAWKRLRDTRRSYANQLAELAEKTVNSKWMKMSPVRSEKIGTMLQQTTLWQIDPEQGTSQPKLMANVSTKRWTAKVNELNAAWAKLDNEQKDLYRSVQKYFQQEYSKIRRAGVDLAVDLYGATLTQPQRTILYSLRDADAVDKVVGHGALIDLGEGNDKFKKVLRDLIRVSAIKGPYFPLMRKGDLVVEAAREGTLTDTYDTRAAAEVAAASVRTRAPKNTAKVVEENGKFRVNYKIRNVSFHTSQADAREAIAELKKLGFDVEGGVFTRKLESVESAALSEGLKELMTKAEALSNAGGANAVEQKAIVQTLQSAFMQILAERAASASQQLKRQGVEGFKGKEAHEIFARRVRASSWHYANLKTAVAQSKALTRLRTFTRDMKEGAMPPHMDPQGLALTRGRVMHEITERLRIEADESSSLERHNMDFVIGQLGFLNFLLTPSYTLVNMMQNFNVAMPFVTARYGLRGAKSMLRAMKVVSGPAFGTAIRGLFNKPGEITTYDVYSAIATAVGEHPRFARFTESAHGKPSALQQLVDMGVINASFIQELAAVANNQNLQVARGMEWLRLFPQGAELWNRITTSLAVLEATNGDVEAAAETVWKTHFGYDVENRPRYFRKIGRTRLPQALTMFKMYGVGMYQLTGSLVTDAVSRRGQSKADRARAATALAGIIAAHVLSAGVVGGIMLEPLRLLRELWNALFGDDDELSDLDTSVQKWATEVSGSEWWGRVISHGAWNALGFDLGGRMGLDRVLMYRPPEGVTEDDLWKFVGSTIGGPVPAMVIQKWARVNELLDQGRTSEAIMEAIPLRMLQDARKGWQLISEGIQSRSGETVAGAENFSWVDAMGRAAGFQTTEEGKAADQAGTAFAYRGWRTARVRELSAAFWNANESGDRAAEAAAVAAIDRFNQKNPGAPITRTSLMQSKRTAQRAVRERTGEGRNQDLNRLLDY